MRAPRAQEKRVEKWREYKTKAGRAYYVNLETKEKSWTAPASLLKVKKARKLAAKKTDVLTSKTRLNVQNTAPARRGSTELQSTHGGWKQSRGADGKTYWYNRITKQKVFKKPAGFDAASALEGERAGAKALKGLVGKPGPAVVAAAAVAAAVAAAATSPPDTPLAEWREHHDEGSGRTYYSNLATKARSWTLPDGGVVVEYAPSVLAARAAAAAEAEAEAEAEATAAAAADAAAAAAPAHENSAAAPVDGAEMWTEHYADGSDPPSFFYVHRTTGERVWSLPAGGLHTPAPERASSASHEEGGDGELADELEERRDWVRDRNANLHKDREARRRAKDDGRLKARATALRSASAARRASIGEEQERRKLTALSVAAACAVASAAAAAAALGARGAREMMRHAADERKAASMAKAEAASLKMRALRAEGEAARARANETEAAAAAAAASAAAAAAATAAVAVWQEHYVDDSDPPKWFFSNPRTGERVWSLPAGARHAPAPERAAFAAAAAAVARAPPTRRAALLFGNCRCAGRAMLRYPRRTVDALHNALLADGYESTALFDSTAAEMDSALIDFMLKCGGLPIGTIAFVYFAGYAAIMRSGVAYFVPSDKRVQSRAEAEQSGVSIADAIALLSTALPNAPASIVALTDVVCVALDDDPALHIDRSTALPPLRLAPPDGGQRRASLYGAAAARSAEGERGRVSESVLEALRSEGRGADLVRVVRAARDGMRGGARESMLQIDSDGDGRGGKQQEPAPQVVEEDADSIDGYL